VNEVVVEYFKISQNLVGESEENHEKYQYRLSCLPEENQTKTSILLSSTCTHTLQERSI